MMPRGAVGAREVGTIPHELADAVDVVRVAAGVVEGTVEAGIGARTDWHCSLHGHAFDAAAPDEGESDWAYALRWSRPADAATVFAAMQAANEADPHMPATASDGLALPRKEDRRSLTLGDSRTLAAAAWLPWLLTWIPWTRAPPP